MSFSKAKTQDSACYLDSNWSQVRRSSPVSFESSTVYQSYVGRTMFSSIIAGSVLALFATTADAQTTITSIAGCPVTQCYTDFATNYPAGIDLFPIKSTPSSADAGWNVVYYPTYKIVSNFVTDEQYILWSCGTTQPSATSNNAIRADAKYFSVPIQGACVDETVPATYIELLGVRQTVKAFDTTYATSPCFNTLATTNAVPLFQSLYGNITLRAIQENSCNVVIGGNTAATKTEPSPAKYISFAATLETSVLNRAEWIKFLALFYNREAAANEVYSGIASRYQALATRAKARAVAINNQPIVAWLVYSSYSSPPYQISTAAYKMGLISNAGGIPYQPATIGFATANALTDNLMKNNVNIIIDETYALADYAAVLATYNLTTANPANYKFLSSQNVWRDDKAVYNSVGDDWFESALPNADAVLNDVVTIVQPSVTGLSPTRWFRNVAKNETTFTLVNFCADLYGPAPALLAPASTAAYTCPTYLTNVQSYYQNVTTSAPTSAPTTKPISAAFAVGVNAVLLACLGVASSVFLQIF